MKMHKNDSVLSWIACLALPLALFTGSAFATIYVKDPVPIGPTGYTAGKLPGQGPTASPIVGCSGNWTSNTGTILANVSNLAYPAGVGRASGGGSFSISFSGDGALVGRASSRSIATSGLPSSGTLYFSTLIKVDEVALSKLRNDQAYFIGISRTDYNASDASVVTFPATGVHVGFKKVSGVFTLSLGVNGTSYPIVPSVTAGETYFCVVEIQLNAGDAGKEIVTAIVNPTGPNMIGTYTVSTSAADVVAAGTTFTYLNLGGLHATFNGYVYFDEFLMADTNDDVCPPSATVVTIR